MPMPGRFGSTPAVAVARMRRPGRAEPLVRVAVDDRHRRGAVVDPAGVAGGDGAVGPEGRPEPGQPLDGHTGAGAVVAVDATDRDDLLVEAAGLLGRICTSVGLRGIAVLALPRDAALGREQVRGEAHVGVTELGGGEGRAFVALRLLSRRRWPEPPGRGGDGLGAAGEDQSRCLADQRGRRRDRRETAAALPVHGQPRNRHRQSGGQGRDASDVAARAHAVAEHHLLDR